MTDVSSNCFFCHYDTTSHAWYATRPRYSHRAEMTLGETWRRFFFTTVESLQSRWLDVWARPAAWLQSSRYVDCFIGVMVLTELL